MTFTLGGKAMIVEEEIKWYEDSLLVDFIIISHPTHKGNVINQIEKHENGDLYLKYEMKWNFQGEGPDPMSGLQMKNTVEDSIKYIEDAYAAS